MDQNDVQKVRVHSIESFGAADGPGVRFIVFLQGCNMRCKYCHNPDTWNMNDGEEMTSDELLKRALRYKSYWKDSGGITVSGGEPLLHIDFLIDFFRRAKDTACIPLLIPPEILLHAMNRFSQNLMN